MAAPYGRKSRTRSRMRRAANMRYTPVASNFCSNCDTPKLSHHICSSCGQYAGRQVIAVVER